MREIPMEPITTRIPVELKRELSRVAELEDRSQCNLIRVALTQYLKNHPKNQISPESAA